MKNTLNYYYNFIPNNIVQKKEGYYFNCEGKEYAFLVCVRKKDEIIELYDIQSYLHSLGIYVHTIILNNMNDLLTMFDNKPYILLERHIICDRIITIEDLNRFTINYVDVNVSYIKREKWWEMWSTKIDYLESYYNEKYCNNGVYKEFPYFLGLVENALQLLLINRNKNNEDSKFYIQHQRLYNNMRVEDLYNPINIVVDYRVRDMALFYKINFFRNEFDLNLFILNIKGMSNNEIVLLFIRIMFVNEYFDLFEKTIENNQELNKKDIFFIVDNIQNYEYYLTRIYLYLYNNYIFPEIEWLN